jgi:hypothetical protein
MKKSNKVFLFFKWIIWTTYYGCQLISIEIGIIGHGAFFKQRPTFNIIFLETSNGTKKIVFYKGKSENTKPKVMK